MVISMEKRLESLVEVAERTIIDMIITGKLKLGSRITESELAEMLSLSTAPVHQALHILGRMGIVRIRPRKGTYIFDFTIEDIRKMTIARYMIESEALRRACSNNLGRFCLEMSRIISRSDIEFTMDNMTQYLKHDADFHELLFTYADNEFLTMASNAITIKVMVLWYLSILDNYTVKDMEDSFNDHHEILEKIIANDIDGACCILKKHLERLENIYLRDK